MPDMPKVETNLGGKILGGILAGFILAVLSICLLGALAKLTMLTWGWVFG